MSSPTGCELGGRAALVCGGAGGIGYAVADELAGAGAAVSFVDAGGSALERAAIRLASHTVACDLQVVAEVEAAVFAARDEHGRLDILVWAPTRYWEGSVEAAMAAIDAGAEAMAKGAEGGRIVVISPANAAAPEEIAERRALLRAVQARAVQLARRRIGVNAVVPGWVNIPSREPGADPESESNPLGMVGEPRDVAAAALWLADPANVFVTGAEVAVDGGQSAGEGARQTA